MENRVETKYKFLVVDDEAAILDGFVDAFEDQFDIVTANSGEEALDVLKQEDSIGVIVTDQRMPGMNGVDLLQQVKVCRPEVVRVLITGYTDLKTAVDSINKGDVYRYIQKPIDEDTTLEILSDSLGKYTENLEVQQSIGEVKQRIKDRFIQMYESMSSGLAHHINNGLVPTKTFYDLLPQKLTLMKEGKYDGEFFDEFLTQAVSDLSLVQQIVGMFTWVRNCNVEDFHRNKIEELIDVEDIQVHKLLKEKNLELVKEVEPGLPEVVVDRLKIQELFSLLIKNCAKEAPQQSKVVLHVSKVENPGGLPDVRFSVSRRGEVYTKEDIPRLFDPFYKFDRSLRSGINGLDLTNCFIIAAKHGSEIKVESSPDKTSFSVDLSMA